MQNKPKIGKNRQVSLYFWGSKPFRVAYIFVGICLLYTYLFPCCETAFANSSILSIDFSKADFFVNTTAKGAFSGLLPRGFVENFTDWTSSEAKSELLSENGDTFLRFTVNKLDPVVQFYFPIEKIEIPGTYKLSIVMRNPQSDVCLGIRQLSAPYKMFWKENLISSGDNIWREKVLYIHIKDDDSTPKGLFFYLGKGTVDFLMVSLEKISEKEFSDQMCLRPEKSLGNFFRNSRFPIGLQSGWNLDRDFLNGDVSSDPHVVGPSKYPSLRVHFDSESSIYSEPFQTSDPSVENYILVTVKGAGKWKISIINHNPWGEIASKEIVLSNGEWRDEKISFKPDNLTRAFGVKISGKGTLFIDLVKASITPLITLEDRERPEVALSLPKSEISDTRIQFEDTPAKIKYYVHGKWRGAVLKSNLYDLYGNIKVLPDILLLAHATGESLATEGEIDFSDAMSAKYGQFKIEAWLEKDGKKISPSNEIVITRIRKPRYWKKDANESAFGAHFTANPLAVVTMKAAGVNWVRLHDAGIEYIGWWWLEPEKGKWLFRDSEINQYRKQNIKIFAQLGTAPMWASYLSKVDRGYDSFFYHDRYYQPICPKDFANYVRIVAERYRGVIDEYFVWNEPWCPAWWAVSFDKTKKGTDGYITSENPTFDFTNLMKTAYSVVKSVDESIKISGFNTTTGSKGEKWTAGVYENGGIDFCDIIDFHCYTEKNTAYPYDPIERGYESALGYILNREPRLKKKIYISEGQGTSDGTSKHLMPKGYTGLYKNTITWIPDTNEEFTSIADKTCRYVVSALSKNISKIFLYSAHSYFNLCVPANFLVLLAPDGYPHPTLVAFSNMAYLLEDKKFTKLIKIDNDLFAYTFSGTEENVIVLAPLRKKTISIPSSKEILSLDIYGNQIYDSSKESPYLIYLVSRLDEERLIKAINPQ